MGPSKAPTTMKSTHRTGGAKLGGWRPEDKPVGLDDCKSPVVFHRVVVCTEMYQYYQSPTYLVSVEYLNLKNRGCLAPVVENNIWQPELVARHLKSRKSTN